MITYHNCPEGKSVFECPFEEHLPPSEQNCKGCRYLSFAKGEGEEYPVCISDEVQCKPLEGLDECPEGNTEEYCSLDDGDCIVGQAVDPEMMMKLLDL